MALWNDSRSCWSHSGKTSSKISTCYHQQNLRLYLRQQVAQRATIAHLSPMCQGQMRSFQKDRIKTTKKRWRHHFPHYKSMGVFCCHGNQSCDPICPKTLCSLSPTPVMLHIKFDQDWPTGFRDIQVWMCGRRTDDDLVSLRLRWAKNLNHGQLVKVWS